CSIHQQPGRTRRAHDEAAAEDLWWLPLRARRRRFRSDPLAPLHSQEARLGPSLNVDHRPPAPHRHASAGLKPACDTWAVTIIYLVDEARREVVVLSIVHGAQNREDRTF